LLLVGTEPRDVRYDSAYSGALHCLWEHCASLSLCRRGRASNIREGVSGIGASFVGVVLGDQLIL